MAKPHTPRSGSVEDLERQRDAEIASMKHRIQHVSDTLHGAPARWVGAHPYLATSGAALAGFFAGKVVEFHHTSPPAPPKDARHFLGEHDGKRHSEVTPLAGWMALLMPLAEKWLMQRLGAPGGGGGEAGAGEVVTGNAGTVNAQNDLSLVAPEEAREEVCGHA